MLDYDIAKNLITEQMPVVCSEDGQIAVVDHLIAPDLIKLTRDKDGRHHYIPLAWVTKVDDKVHLDRPGTQAKKDWGTSPADVGGGAPAAAHANSVDATRGQPLVDRVMARKHELEALRAQLPTEHHHQADIELALGHVESLLTGDLDHVPEVVAIDMNHWLERNKHLAEDAGD